MRNTITQKIVLTVALLSMITSMVLAQEAPNPNGVEIDGSLNTTQIGSNNHEGDVISNSNSDSSVHHEATDLSKGLPTVYSSSLTTSGHDTCFGSQTGTLSIPGLGIGGAKTIIDENCVRLKNAKMFVAIKLPDVAVALLMQRPENAAAVKVAHPALYEKFKAILNTDELDHDDFEDDDDFDFDDD